MKPTAMQAKLGEVSKAGSFYPRIYELPLFFLINYFLSIIIPLLESYKKYHTKLIY